MKDKNMTKEQLLRELEKARQQIAEWQETALKNQRAAETLRESNDRYQSLTEKMSDIIWTMDLNLRSTYLSPSIDKFLGTTPEERPTLHPENMMTPESYNQALELLAKELQIELEGNADPDRQVTFEGEYRHKNGHTVWAEGVISAIRDEEGFITGIYGVSRDITQRKKAEEALKASEKRFRDLTDFLPQIIFEIDLRGQFTFVNQAAITMSEYGQDDLTKGINILDVIIPQERERAISNMQKILAGHQSEYNHYTFLKKDGSTFPVIVNSSPIIQDNKITGLRGFVVDMTEIKRAEDALRESEIKYRSIFNNTTEGIFQTTPKGKVLTANPSLAKILGYASPEDLIAGIKNLGTDLYVQAEKRQEFLDLMDKQGYVRDFAYQAYRKDRRIIDVSINVDTIHDENQNFLYFEGVLKDITELKKYREHMEELVRERTAELLLTNKKLQEEISERIRAEEALRESETKYRSIFNNTTEGIFQTTPVGRILTANPSLAKILGYDSPEALISSIKNLAKDLFVRPDRRQDFLELMKRDDYVRNFEYQAYCKDRRIIDASINVDTIRDENNNFLYFEGVFKDVTELKKYREHMEDLVRERTGELMLANKKLQDEINERQQSEEKFSKTFHNAPLLMTINDISTGRFIDVNEKFIEVSGFSREEAIGRSSLELGWMSREDLHLLTGKLKQEGIIESTEFNLKSKDNRYVCCIYNGEAISVGDKQVLLSIALDITQKKIMEEEKKKLEERLQRSEKMEALGTMAGGVAHDLNNILGVLVGYSELMLLEISPTHPLRRHVNNILKSGERASAIIQDMLTLARRSVTTSEIIDLNNIITTYFTLPEFEVLRSYHPQVSIKTDLEKNLLNIKGSPVHLTKSVMNLVSNAAEAIPDFGAVMIQTGNVYLDRPLRGYDDMREGDYVTLKISDTGKGISANDIGKIFEPFYTKKVMGRSGTGLGLAVVWGTMKDHHGFIDVQSEENKGTTFTLYFPATREEKLAEQEAISPETYRSKGESILVVDDVKEQRELATQMLQKLGYKVNSAAGGEAAITFIRNNKTDLLILDMIMDPGIDGLETYQRIRQINPQQKAIIVSGFSETDRVKKAQELGAGVYVRKPYVLESLGLAVRQELDRTI
jgi:two-component system, cell cycle sensor histidine kinase and response regulator CckA